MPDLQEYEVDGRTYLFLERDVPKGAKLVSTNKAKNEKAPNKAKVEKPANKAAEPVAPAATPAPAPADQN